METIRVRMNVGILLLYLTLAAISLTHCDAVRSMRLLKGPKHRRNIVNKNPKKLKMVKHLDGNPTIFSSNAQPYSVSSPFSLPPYESLAPIPLPENSPPFCVFPPPNSDTPSTTFPTPTGSQPTIPSPPSYYISPPSTPIIIIPGPPGFLPTPTPEIVPGPPTNIPGSPEPVTNPPIIIPGPPEPSMGPPYFEPGPPYFEPSPPFIPSPSGGTIPSPPSYVPSPTEGTVPSPTVFQPPVVYPPPSVPPPPNYAPRATLWCVAKPSVPDPIIQEAMNYACWSGADCTSIQPNGPCYEPDTVFAHASYAFNSYWQRTKAAGGNCEFGGTAMLVAVDPSYDGCRFISN
ncbi:leucine-rich repeat extensin-like protein 5 [Abrus precatorius]|uniref:Leucine-rich repeat extensin-like protein 5 n=1 Tax=Abrus precatorius TaxID=3816 RepID=A0A8B8KGX9_ABRPR|nr:leucine-rich repeat extensin-like protein 5 [Abrus precatorius]